MPTRTSKTSTARKPRPASRMVKSPRAAVLPTPKPIPIPMHANAAMVIVVEENEAQGYSVTWASIFKTTAKVMLLGLSDLDLNLPGWLKDLIRASGKVTDKIVDGVRAGFSEMLGEIVGDTRKALNSAGVPQLDKLLNKLSNQITIPNGFAAFKNDYGEAVYGDILQAMAAPFYGKVVVLTDQAATFDNFKATLLDLNRQGFVIDIVLDIHGCGDSTALNNGYCGSDKLLFTGQEVTLGEIENINGGQPLQLNAVYMVSCWGSRFNAAWRKLGAKASNGANELNYYVLLSPFAFMQAWTVGNQSLTAAAQFAYDTERALLNGKSFNVSITVGREPFTGKKIKWSTSVGVTWQKLMNKLLSGQPGNYGLDKSKPVDNVASSRRVPLGDAHRA